MVGSFFQGVPGHCRLSHMQRPNGCCWSSLVFTFHMRNRCLTKTHYWFGVCEAVACPEAGLPGSTHLWVEVFAASAWEPGWRFLTWFASFWWSCQCFPPRVSVIAFVNFQSSSLSLEQCKKKKLCSYYYSSPLSHQAEIAS